MPTSTPVTTDPSSARRPRDLPMAPPTAGVDRLRRRALTVALVASPALMLTGAVLHPEESTDPAVQLAIVRANAGRWLAVHLILFAAGMFVVPAFHGLAARLRTSAPGAAFAGVVLGGAGAFGLAGIFVIEGLAASRLAGLAAHDAAAASFDRLLPVGTGFAAFGLLFHIGALVLGVALFRTARERRWVGAVLAVGAVVMAVGLVAEIGPLAAGGLILIAVAMVTTAVSNRASVEP